MSNNQSKTVFVGMSGGVDSSVSAVLLKEQGYNVVGVYMKNWARDLPGMKCPWAEDLADAKRVAVRLGIDFLVFDFQQEYKNKVVDYMLAEFKKGNTPNPDIMCNQEIKFKLFYDIAREKGADFIATGHYARIGSGKGQGQGQSQNQTQDGEWQNQDKDQGRRQELNLLKAIDENKDQTYFLYRISQEAINHTLFPVGDMLKSDVKKLAAEYGLDNAYKKESMGVCFVGEVGIKDFLKEYIEIRPGEVRDAETGELLGTHEGAIFYTTGQRKGLNIGGGIPYYVVKKDIKRNIVYISKNLNNANLWRKELELKDVIIRRQPFDKSDESDKSDKFDELKQPSSISKSSKNTEHSSISKSSKIDVRLRHRAPLIPAELVTDGHTARLIFGKEIKAPAAGQSAVFYDGDICIGGGIIV